VEAQQDEEKNEKMQELNGKTNFIEQLHCTQCDLEGFERPQTRDVTYRQKRKAAEKIDKDNRGVTSNRRFDRPL